MVGHTCSHLRHRLWLSSGGKIKINETNTVFITFIHSTWDYGQSQWSEWFQRFV